MKLDRNINGMGKYALLKLRRLRKVALSEWVLKKMREYRESS